MFDTDDDMDEFVGMNSMFDSDEEMNKFVEELLESYGDVKVVKYKLTMDFESVSIQYDFCLN